MDKTKKIFLILLVSFFGIFSATSTYAEEVDMSFLADILNGDFNIDEGTQDTSIPSSLEVGAGDTTTQVTQAPSTPSNNSYTSEAMYQAQNSNQVVTNDIDYNYNPFENSNNNGSVGENSENVAVNKLPQTGAEHALLLLLSITMAGFVFYKKRIK